MGKASLTIFTYLKSSLLCSKALIEISKKAQEAQVDPGLLMDKEGVQVGLRAHCLGGSLFPYSSLRSSFAAASTTAFKNVVIMTRTALPVTVNAPVTVELNFTYAVD